MNEKWLYGPERFPGLSRNGPQTAIRPFLSFNWPNMPAGSGITKAVTKCTPAASAPT